MNCQILLVAAGMMLPARMANPAESAHHLPSVQARVEVEENVYQYEPADNGAGPMWSRGSTCLVRVGQEVFASGLETLPKVKPLCNCRWLLYQRRGEGWRLVARNLDGRTREPCPLAAFPDGRLFLSDNPTQTPPDQYGGPAQPQVFQFATSQPDTEPAKMVPLWNGTPPFTEHSYRSFAADGPRRELILLQNIGYTHAEWTFYDSDGSWSAQGKLEWPWGAEYDRPQPIRICYPTVALENRKVYFCGVSDIIEPYDAWREYKQQLTGRQWDYDFRRLFFTWSDDITSEAFHPWVEIASRDETCGWITPLDLWIAPNGNVHLLWNERATDLRLRDRFFPDQEQSTALNHAVVRAGEVIQRQTLMEVREGQMAVTPGAARFHILPDARLLVLLYVSGTDADGRSVSENRVLEILPSGRFSSAVKVDLQHPLNAFFTATPRAGSAPSFLLDLLGTRADAGPTISYTRIRFGKRP